MNMFQPTIARNIEDYINSVPEDRRNSIIFLNDFIIKTVPSLKPYFATNMLGYGSFWYKNSKKETIEWPIIALANQKQYISIYVCAIRSGEYITEKYKETLGKVKVGRSCIRIGKLEDVNLAVLKKALQEAAKNPGSWQK